MKLIENVLVYGKVEFLGILPLLSGMTKMTNWVALAGLEKVVAVALLTVVVDWREWAASAHKGRRVLE